MVLAMSAHETPADVLSFSHCHTDNLPSNKIGNKTDSAVTDQTRRPARPVIPPHPYTALDAWAGKAQSILPKTRAKAQKNLLPPFTKLSRVPTERYKTATTATSTSYTEPEWATSPVITDASKGGCSTKMQGGGRLNEKVNKGSPP